MSEMLLEIGSSRPAVSVKLRSCKTSQISQKTSNMESFFRKPNCKPTVLKRNSSSKLVHNFFSP